MLAHATPDCPGAASGFAPSSLESGGGDTTTGSSDERAAELREIGEALEVSIRTVEERRGSMATIVYPPELPISPRVIDLKAESPHPFDHVILGNSITLTPGTLAIDVHEGVIKVHTLTEEGARELVSGEMNRRVIGMREE